MTPKFSNAADAIPVTVVSPDQLDTVLAQLAPAAAHWATTMGFAAKAGECLALPGPDGKLTAALIGIGGATARARGRFYVGLGASRLPAGDYEIVAGLDPADLTEAALGWLLESYRFDQYKSQDRSAARLVAPKGIDAARIEAIVAGECLTRDLINTPSSDMGPRELQAAAHAVAGGRRRRGR